MGQYISKIKQALPPSGADAPPPALGTSGDCIQDDVRTQGDPKGLNCCSQNGTYGTWRSGFYCLSKQGLTLTSSFMKFPIWFWLIFITASLSILLTKILGRS